MDAPTYYVTYLLAANVIIVNDIRPHVLYMIEIALKMIIRLIVMIITGFLPNSQKSTIRMFSIFLL